MLTYNGVTPIPTLKSILATTQIRGLLTLTYWLVIAVIAPPQTTQQFVTDRNTYFTVKPEHWPQAFFKHKWINPEAIWNKSGANGRLWCSYYSYYSYYSYHLCGWNQRACQALSWPWYEFQMSERISRVCSSWNAELSIEDYICIRPWLMQTGQDKPRQILYRPGQKQFWCCLAVFVEQLRCFTVQNV